MMRPSTLWPVTAACAAIVLASAAATAAEYQLKEVLAAIKAADAQFANLTIKATSEWPPEVSNSSKPVPRITGEYRMKEPEGWEFESQTRTNVDPRTNTPVGPTPLARVIAFDGAATIFLSPDKKRRGDLLDATVARGRMDLFSSFGNPHYNIWRYGKRSNYFDELFTRLSSKFQTPVAQEVVEGVQTLKLEGTIDDGQIRIQLWVIPSKNYVPLRAKVYSASNGELLHEKAYSDYKQIGSSIWYPMLIKQGGDLLKPETLITTRIDSISTDPLTVEQFQPRIPPNTHVSDLLNDKVYITSKLASATRPTTTNVDDSERSLRDYVDEANSRVKAVGSAKP